MRPHFRFEDLEIWQLARILAVKLHKLAGELDKKRLYRYAEQLRSLGLLNSGKIDGLLADCDMLSRKITNFSRSLTTSAALEQQFFDVV